MGGGGGGHVKFYPNEKGVRNMQCMRGGGGGGGAQTVLG